MKPRTILFLIRSWAFGGSHTVVLHLMKHLPRDRFNVVCVPYDTFSGSDELFIEQVRLRGLPLAEDRVPWKSRSNWNKARSTVSRLITKYQADLIHTHDPHSNTMIGIGRSAWPCACAASAYGWWDGPLPLRRTVYQWIERQFALPHFERVITVSEHMKARILRGPTPEDRIRIIHTGIELDTVRKDADGSAFRAKLGIPADAVVVGTVSRVSVEKGHRYLLAAAAKLRDRHPHMRVLICGDGPARHDLEEQAARLDLRDRVIFAGFISDLPSALAAMDIFAQPSVEQEGFPTSVLEAQAAGLPVVASDIGGTHETMQSNATGLLARPRDPSSLAEALAALIENPKRRAAMGAAGREWVESQFTLERMIDQVIETYEEAIDVHNRRA
ncbi:MAG: glycosyltransferase family 4 protein [Candidatus Hydrogenedentes bacterium]|nr:glycosyltransferase family 4 protein [Candidatus Hydrogenedentota bacterium]